MFYKKLAQAIARAVQGAQYAENEDVRTGVYSLEQRFANEVLSKYQTAAMAFDEWDRRGMSSLSRQDFKSGIAQLTALQLTDADRKALRKNLDSQNSKKISRSQFVEFVESRTGSTVAPEGDQNSPSRMPPLPVDIPCTPDGFAPRPDIQEQVASILINKAQASSLSRFVLLHGMVKQFDLVFPTCA